APPGLLADSVGDGALDVRRAAPGRARWGRSVPRATRNTLVVLGLLGAVLVVGMAIFADRLAPRAPDDQTFDLIESRPSAQAVFEAVRALGATRVAVALKHVLPNVISPFVVQGTVALSQAILIEASLSYLGLSAQPPTPSWGNMLNEGRTYLETAPWISVFPGIAIMLSVLAFNLIGDGLRDILDPNVQ